MSEVTKKARTKRPTSELIKEIGRNRLSAIISATVPSAEALELVLAKEAEAAEMFAKAKEESDSRVADFMNRLGVSLSREANAMREKLGNPANVSEFDRQLVSRAFKLANKVGAISVVRQAEVLRDCLETFPVIGTKY